MHTNIWGIGFIIVGALILINAFFGFNIPILRLLLALLLLYAGISMLISPPRPKMRHAIHGVCSEQVVFGKRTFKHESLASNYQITFGQGIIDLRKQTVDMPKNVDISVTFGSAILKLNPDIPTRVVTSVSFGKVEFPDDNQLSMGTNTYQNYQDGTEPMLIIQAQVSFGSLEIENE